MPNCRPTSSITVTLKGRTLYGYKDEKAGVVYLGNEAQYAQYKQLATNAKLKAKISLRPLRPRLKRKTCIPTAAGIWVAFRRSPTNCDSRLD